jgi:hypothetical protein
VQILRGVAVEPKAFSYFPELKLKPSTEPPVAEPLSQLEEPPAALDARIQKFTEFDQACALAETRVARLEGSVSDAMTRLEEILAGFRGQTDRIAAGLAHAHRLADVVSGVEQRIAALREREGSLTHTADRIASALVEADRLADVVSGAEQRIATLRERELSLTHAADRIAPALAAADRLADVVSGVEQRIATLRERELSLTHTADRIAPALADTDRLADVVSGVVRRIATLRERVISLIHARPVVEEPNRAVEPAPLLRQVSVDTARPREDRSGLGGLKGIIGRHAVAAGLLGLLAVVAVGGLVARRPRLAVPAPTTQHTSEGHIAAASIPPSPIPPSPISAATTAPTTPGIPPAAIKSASGTSRSSKVTTRQRTRSRQAVRDPSPPPVFAGNLAVQSNPAGGTVFIDRQRVGETPLRLTRLTAGSHVVWIESEGHARWTAAVQVNTDKLVRVNATLQPQR